MLHRIDSSKLYADSFSTQFWRHSCSTSWGGLFQPLEYFPSKCFWLQLFCMRGTHVTPLFLTNQDSQKWCRRHVFCPATFLGNFVLSKLLFVHKQKFGPCNNLYTAQRKKLYILYFKKIESSDFYLFLYLKKGQFSKLFQLLLL